MHVRRVVIATDRSGRSVVSSDDASPRAHDFINTPGFGQALVWTTPPRPTLPFDGIDPASTAPSLVPDPGATSFIVLTFPPDAVYADSGFDGAAAAGEAAEHSPGIAETLDPDNPGMHTTSTVDYNIVLDGEVWIELSDGAQVKLVAGDVVVQHGARHAWRNKSGRPATIAAILIGAQRARHTASG